MDIAIKAFALIGMLCVGLLMLGAYLDFRDFDRTKGGYEPPYEGVTGQPVDWDGMDRTATGLVKRGHVINVLVNGTTGMISFEVFKTKFAWRGFSERALAVHKPREALKRRGFDPVF